MKTLKSKGQKTGFVLNTTVFGQKKANLLQTRINDVALRLLRPAVEELMIVELNTKANLSHWKVYLTRFV